MPQQTSAYSLCSLYHRVFSGGVLRFQLFQKSTFSQGGIDYPYRDFTLPRVGSRNAQLTNTPQQLIIRRTDARQDQKLPWVDIIRAFDGLGGAVLRVVQVETHRDRVRPEVYQIRGAYLAETEGEIIFELQASGLDANWPIIGGVSYVEQLI